MDAPDLVGTQLGSYVVEALLGSGGMAHVYRGFDQNLQRPVAIKILSNDAGTQPGFVECFHQEARMIAGLRHPHIVQVYDFGQQHGYTYMVQELLPGPTLEHYLQSLAAHSKAPGRQDIVSIVTQLASALDMAHAAGIVHRDVKPGNALWNAAGALVLTDFGIARHILTENNTLQAGIVMGTPHYLSPEQAQGLHGTSASDIYALGVVLYEMIAGRVPFRGQTRDEVIFQQIHTLPPLLSIFYPEILPAVEEVVQRALAKNPDERFKRARDLAHALRYAWPPAYEGTNRRSVSDKGYSSHVHIWRGRAVGTETEPDHHDPAPSIHSQKTVIASDDHHRGYSFYRMRSVQGSATRQSQSVAQEQSSTRRNQRAWELLPLILGTLLVFGILSFMVVELQYEYRATLDLANRTDLIEPTRFPTSRLLLPTTATTPSPPARVAGAEVAATPPATRSAHADMGASLDTEPPMPATPVTHNAHTSGITQTNVPDNRVASFPPVGTPQMSPTPLDMSDPATLSTQFAQLRMLIETNSTDGWARIDRTAWLQRLDDIQRAVEEGNTQQAGLWLDEMRQTLLHNVDDGTITPEVAERVFTNIDSIALNNGIVLPSVTTPVIDDG